MHNTVCGSLSLQRQDVRHAPYLDRWSCVLGEAREQVDSHRRALLRLFKLSSPVSRPEDGAWDFAARSVGYEAVMRYTASLCGDNECRHHACHHCHRHHATM